MLSERDNNKDLDSYVNDGDSTLENKTKEEVINYHTSKQHFNEKINSNSNTKMNLDIVNISNTPLKETINNNNQKECLFQCYITETNDNDKLKKRRKKNVKIREPFIDEEFILSYKRYNLKMTYIEYADESIDDAEMNRTLKCKCKRCNII